MATTAAIVVPYEQMPEVLRLIAKQLGNREEPESLARALP